MRLEKELNCNFRLEEQVTPSADEILEESAPDSSSGVEECGYFKQVDFKGDEERYKVAVKMLGTMTMQGFTDLRKEILENFDIPKKWLPSFAKLTKNRPKIIGFECEPNLLTRINCAPVQEPSTQPTDILIQDLEDVGLDVDFEDINATTMTSAPLVPKQNNVSITSFIGTDMSLKECHDELKAANLQEKFMLGKIEGEYKDYVKLLKERHLKKSLDPFCNKRAVIIDSYDGAQHEKTAKNETNIVSFSSKLVSDQSLREGYGGGTSLDILTWQQMRGDETARNIFPAIENILENKKEMVDEMTKNPDGDQYDMYELHDGKMIYLLTGHALYNRKFHPFVLCKCMRGDGLKEGHVCKIISHEETVQMWDKSKKRWERKHAKLKAGEKYTKKIIWIMQINISWALLILVFIPII